MGDFGKVMSGQFGSLFLNQPPKTMMTDPRTGYLRAEEARRIAAHDALARQYADAQRNPNWGTGTDPIAQKYMEQELIDSVYNRLGAGGALGSGTARASAAKALADYRLGLLSRRNAALEKLRADMIGAASVGGTPYTVTPVEGQESFARGLAREYVGGMLGGMPMGI